MQNTGVNLQNMCLSGYINCSLSTCDSCVAASKTWIGYCVNSNPNADMMGVAWGGNSGNNDCSIDQVSREFTLECEDTNGGSASCNGSQVSTASPGFYKGVGVTRQDISFPSSLNFLDSNGNYDSSGFFKGISLEMILFGLYGGHTSYVDGPPGLYQHSGYLYIPKGSFGEAGGTLTGTAAFVVYDAAFTYAASSYPSGIGATTSFTGVTSSSLLGSVTSLVDMGSDLNRNLTIMVCSSGNTVCLRQITGASGFERDGLQISDSASKVDVIISNITYPGGDDSCGLRMMSVFTSFEGTVSVDDTGDQTNEESETFGAGFLITQNTINASNSPISSSNLGTSVSVLKNKQTLTSTSGSECGYTSGDWYPSTQTEGSTTYTNAGEYFKAKNFAKIDCLFFSFTGGTRNFLWDPILGVDKTAAKEAALSSIAGSGSGGDSSSSSNIGAIVGGVVGGLVGVILIATGVWYFTKKNAQAGQNGMPMFADNL